MPEDRRLIGNLSVEDNLRLPAWAQGIGDLGARLETVYGLIPELRELRSRSAGALSGGQQKLVALGRSFVAGRRLLLLDEPFEGVAPTLAHRLLEVIRAFRDRQPGLSVLVCESSFDWVRKLADEVHFIERGETTRAV
jgi:branched-chain amino acid transport system ATP-binding protein